MITVHYREHGQILESRFELSQTLPHDCVWIDLENPDDDERAFIADALHLEFPPLADMKAIEASSRMHGNAKALYMTVDVIAGAETPTPVQDALLIILTPKILITMRATAPKSLQLFARRIKEDPELIITSEDGLLGMLDAITDRIADILEGLGRNADRLSITIFQRGKNKGKEERLQEILCRVGHVGDITHKIQDSISGLARVMNYLEHFLGARFAGDQKGKFLALDRDVKALAEHALFVQQQSTFLLDATLGQTNIEQNNVIKFLSIVMVAFTPPTFFASMWGMNFHNMPEYGWVFGYGMAWIVMIISGLLPLLYFRRRGWL